MINIFDKKTSYSSALKSNGLYNLDKLVIMAETTEDISGNYELNMELELLGDVPTGLYDSIQVDNIIKVNDEYSEELFRIAQVNKGLDTIEIYARHITIADSLNLWLDNVKPTNLSGLAALQWLKERTTPKCNLLFKSNISSTNTADYVRRNLYSALFEEDNAFIKRWGGEVQRRGYTITIDDKIGADKSETIKIKESLNLTAFNGSSNIDEVSTVIYPVGFDGITAPPVKSPLINNYSMEFPIEIKYENVKVKKKPEEGQEEDPNAEGFDTLAEAQVELQRLAALEFSKNNIDKLQFTFDLDYVDLERFEEYKNLSYLQTADIGDTVTVRVDTFNMDIKARIIARKYDVLRGRRIENTLSTDGKQKKPEDIKDIIKDIVQQETDKQDIWEGLGPHIDDLIQQGFKKGYVVYEKNAVYAVDRLPKEQAKNVVVLNNGGLGHSSTGIKGPYKYGFTIDGAINASMITTGTLNGQYIGAGTIEANKLTVSAKKEIANQFGETDQFINLQTDVTGLKSTVGEIKKSNEEQNAKISQIEQTAEKIKATVANVENKIQDQTIKISEIEQTAEGVKTTVANVKKTVQGQNAKISQIEQTANGIKTTVANVEKTVQGQTTKISQIEQTTNGISTKVESAVKKATSAEKKVSQLQQTTEDFKFSIEHRGNVNLLRGSNAVKVEESEDWNTSKAGTSKNGFLNRAPGGSQWAFPDKNVDTFQLTLSDNGSLSGGEVGFYQQSIKVQPDTEYTLSFYAAGHRVNLCYVYVRGTRSNWWGQLATRGFNVSSGGGSISAWTRQEIKFTTQRDEIVVEFGFQGTTSANPFFWIAKPMLNKGAIAAEYTQSQQEVHSGITKIDMNGVRCDFEDGTYAEMGRDGFKYKHSSWEHPFQYYTKIVKVARQRNGYWTTINLGREFKGKQLDRDFTINHHIGAVDCNAYVTTGQYGGALRQSFTEIRNWDPYNATIQARCCIQKITLKTEVFFGWDSATTDTNRGGIIGESAGDIVVIAQM